MKSNFFQNLRGYLIFLVILIHATHMSNVVYENKILIIYRTLANVAVPVFIFLSGYFYNREKYHKNKKEYLSNKLIRLIKPLLLWNVVYFIINYKNLNLIDFFTFKSGAHLYYILVLIQLIIITPVIIKLKDNKKMLYIMLLITPIYLAIYRILWIAFNYVIPYHEFFFFGWSTYYILGIIYRENEAKIKVKNNKSLFLFFIILVSAYIYNVFMFSKFGYRISVSQMNNMNLIVSLAFIKLIVGFKNANFFNKRNILTIIGDYSFGIYFVHLIIVKIIEKIILVNQAIKAVTVASLVYVISFVIVYVFNKIFRGKLNNCLGLN